MRRWMNLAFASVVALVSGLLVVAAQPASAYDVRQAQIVTDNPADWTPNVKDGEIRYLAQSGNTMIAGGLFTQVANAGTTTLLSRTDVFSFDATTGQVNPNFHPTLDGRVYAIVPSPDGNSVFLGGEFRKVNGVSKPDLVEVSLADGSIVSAFKAPALNGRVYTMRMANGQLYVGGAFTQVGTNTTLHHLAAFDPVSGAVNTAFHLDFAGLANPQPDKVGWVTMVTKIDVSPDGSRLAVIGNFATVNGLDRAQVVLADLTSATPKVLDWQTNFYKKFCNVAYESYVHDVSFSPDGSYFVIGTTGGYTKVVTMGCDSTARWETSATGSALTPTWVDFTGKDTIWSVAVTDTAVYTGGHNRWQNNPYGADSAGAGAAARPGLSALDPATGVPFDWNPTRTTGVGVFDMLATDQGLWIGDDTDWVGHEYHYKMAFFPLAGGKTVPKPTTGAAPQNIFQLGRLGALPQPVGQCGATALPNLLDDVVSNRPFDGSTAGPNSLLPLGGTAWGQARGSFMLSGALYTAWTDGSLCKSTFDGSNFGTPAPVDLAPAGVTNNISADLSKVTGMFFSNNRIYYTKTGSTSLYYHYFNPQNDMVGSYVFTASGNVSGIDFSKVGGMFLYGNKLYFVTRSDGVLRRIDWNGSGPVAGSAAPVSGPGIDGAASWAAQALFSYVPADAVAANQAPYANIATNCTDLACVFTSAGSGDADGTLTSYAWDFGDGGSSSARVPAHTFATDGTYTVSLTVIDDSGAVTTTTRSVKVGVVPVPPVPAFSVSCSHLTCSVDGSASTAPGSSVASYTWDFGDGTPTTNDVTGSHTYSVDGGYPIQLTVQSANGLSASTTQSVNVTALAPPISFVGESDVNSNASAWSVKVPAGVVSGDGLVLMTSGNTTATYSAPSGPGWSLVGTKSASSLITNVWQKVATSTDAGSTVIVTGSTVVKANVVLLAYHGTSVSAPVGAYAVAGAPSTSAVHVTPTKVVPADGAWVVSIWSDKSSLTTSIAGPGGQNQRYFGCSASSGRVCSLVDDSGPVLGGTTAGGLTATMDAVSPADTMWTLVLTAQT
jgi:PKD repeat protein